VDDYLRWQGDWELWDGEAVAMSPSPFGIHQQVIVNLAAAMKFSLQAIQCNTSVLVELDWIVNSSTVVRPDVIVVCGDVPEQHLHEAPGLIAEILSPSTRQNDLTYKRDLYASQSVGTYLIIDPVAQTVGLNRLEKGSYREVPADDQLCLQTCDDCNITIPISAIFGR